MHERSLPTNLRAPRPKRTVSVRAGAPRNLYFLTYFMTVGFIGQGWIGKHYADDFERRGFSVVRYAKEEPYAGNKERIGECDMVFIAVPTPTTVQGFKDGIVREVVGLVGKGNIAVIKSTLRPGTTESIQKDYPDIFVLHSPEFLAEATASYDAAHPNRNIVGIPKDTDEYRAKAKEVLAVLPQAPYECICSAKDAELIKYGGNCFLYFKVVYANLLYDLAEKLGCDWDRVREAMAADPRIGASHLNPIHQSGRGAGGHCFIKDFAAFKTLYERMVGDELGAKALSGIEEKNSDLLVASGKDLTLLEGVYGKGFNVVV